jgi:hypothetical protein
VVFASVFEACVALQNGDELSALIDGNRLLAFNLQDRFVLVMAGTLVREGDAFEVAMAFVRTCKALDQGRGRAPRKSSYTRLIAQRDVPIVEEPIRKKR